MQKNKNVILRILHYIEYIYGFIPLFFCQFRKSILSHLKKNSQQLQLKVSFTVFQVIYFWRLRWKGGVFSQDLIIFVCSEIID